MHYLRTEDDSKIFDRGSISRLDSRVETRLVKGRRACRYIFQRCVYVCTCVHAYLSRFSVIPDVCTRAGQFRRPASHNNEDTSRNDRYAYLGNASAYHSPLVHLSSLPLSRPSSHRRRESVHVAPLRDLLSTMHLHRAA